MSSVPLSKGIYESLEVMMKKMVIKVSDLENIYYLYSGAQINPLNITVNTRRRVSSTFGKHWMLWKQAKRAF